MKRKDQFFDPYGLRTRLVLSLVVSGILCLFVFLIMHSTFEYLFVNYYEHSDYEHIQIQRQRDSLQKYVDSNQISSQNLENLRQWEKRQPIVLMELYHEGKCIYNSIHDVPISSMVLEEQEDPQDDIYIQLTDIQVSAFIYSDFTYQFSLIGTALSIVAALIFFIFLFLNRSRKMIGYICRLNEEVQILEGGNLEYCVSEEGNDEITDLARSMNRMRVTLQHQMESEQQLHQANRQLITQMSHDLRTPLTGILLYLEILRSHRYQSDEQLQDYLEKIDAKAHHMKLLSDHLFEYSMKGVPEKQTEPQSMENAFGKAIRNMQDELNARGFISEAEILWENCFVQVNPEYIHRIFENVLSNIEKYAESAVEVRIDTISSDTHIGFSIMNSLAANRLPVESNGVGIESIRSMMVQMHGVCRVEQTDTIFEITLLFPKQ